MQHCSYLGCPLATRHFFKFKPAQILSFHTANCQYFQTVLQQKKVNVIALDYNFLYTQFIDMLSTLKSEIYVPHGINVAPLLKTFTSEF